MKKYILLSLFASTSLIISAQDAPANQPNSKESRRDDKRQRINAMIKQEEEGVLSYYKQNVFGLQMRTNGYGLFYELGRAKTPRLTNLYSIELTEIKDPKEEKSSGGGFLGNPLIYGKINNFYAAKLGFGQQYILGQKGNKNGIAVMAIYQGGISLGFLKPYYVKVNRSDRDVKFQSADSTAFLTEAVAGSGFTKGWGELKFEPGVFVKGALRFDFGRYNEQIQALQIGISAEAYGKKIPIMARNEGDRLFIQGHVAILFGKRK